MDLKDEATAAESVLDSRGRPAAAELVLGPMLRYAGTKSASFWLETNRPCEVEILGRRDRTFCVEGHHYALLLVDDLQPASLIDYDVRLDGRVVWPARASGAHASRRAGRATRLRLLPKRRSTTAARRIPFDRNRCALGVLATAAGWRG
jgi:hypothetical protein